MNKESLALGMIIAIALMVVFLVGRFSKEIDIGYECSTVGAVLLDDTVYNCKWKAGP